MTKIGTALFLLLAGGLSACGQLYKNHSHQQIQGMDTNKLNNSTVKAAFDAWQAGDSKLWLSYFTENAALLDDGNSRNFRKFSTEAIGTERFISINKVEDNGQAIYGNFHSDTWGDFQTYFKFHINNAGKIYRLEIGQAGG